MLELQNFLDSSLSVLEPYLFNHWEIDHACYRTDSLKHYKKSKSDFLSCSTFLIESPIGGRPIATFELNSMKYVGNRALNIIEVPAPKPERTYGRGYEHIEVVIDLPFEQLQEKFADLTWNLKGINKELNPELQTSFSSFNVKFHYHSLAHIINIEKHAAAIHFLNSTQVLAKLKEFQPLISGTIPLGIDTPESDLDILFWAKDFNQFAAKVSAVFPNAILNTNTDYIMAKLNFDGLNIELFGQRIHPLEQTAHRHLRIEGRLLKLLGHEFKQKIKELKLAGVETEPAFGQLLELSNPYEDLLKLYFLSDLELLQRFS